MTASHSLGFYAPNSGAQIGINLGTINNNFPAGDGDSEYSQNMIL